MGGLVRQLVHAARISGFQERKSAVLVQSIIGATEKRHPWRFLGSSGPPITCRRFRAVPRRAPTRLIGPRIGRGSAWPYRPRPVPLRRGAKDGPSPRAEGRPPGVSCLDRRQKGRQGPGPAEPGAGLRRVRPAQGRAALARGQSRSRRPAVLGRAGTALTVTRTRA